MLRNYVNKSIFFYYLCSVHNRLANVSQGVAICIRRNLSFRYVSESFLSFLRMISHGDLLAVNSLQLLDTWQKFQQTSFVLFSQRYPEIPRIRYSQHNTTKKFAMLDKVRNARKFCETLIVSMTCEWHSIVHDPSKGVGTEGSCLDIEFNAHC